MSNSGYQYGLWFIPNDYTLLHSTLHMKHIPHITLVCNITNKSHLSLLYHSIYEYLSITSPFIFIPNPITLSHISYDISNGNSNDCDFDDNSDDKSWGYTCKWNDENIDIYSLINTFMNKFNIKGSISTDFHMTIHYDEHLSRFNHEIETIKNGFIGDGSMGTMGYMETNKYTGDDKIINCKLVMVDIHDHNPAMWKIID